VLTISSKASIKKNRLYYRIEEEGYRVVSPYDRYVRLYKSYVKSGSSDRYSEYIRVSNSKYVISKLTYSDTEWRRLMKI
jgi:hypothetical protein